jgi:hypothetical protein
MAQQQIGLTAVVVERDTFDIEVAVAGLLNSAVIVRRSNSGRGIELECRMCGRRDENHTVACPVPSLEQWLNPI